MDNASKRITIKDIATQTGLSIATVHLALAGKAGPKEETRRRVLQTAKELNYQCNSAASSLKRGVTRIAAILPALTQDNLLYYEPIWRGVRAYCRDAKDFNIELVELPYVNQDSVSVPLEAVGRARGERKLSGLIVLGDIEPEAGRALRDLSDQGVSIVLVNSDTPEVGRICCIQAENYLLGRIMGEILLGRTPRGGPILVCAGEKSTPANADSTRGLNDYLEEHDANREIYALHYGNDMDRLYRRLVERFEKDRGITGCCSVTARGSVQLARALVDTGLAGRIPAIGSDVFGENIENLKRGVFQNLMFKNPYQQGWLAAEYLFKHIFRDQPTGDTTIFVKSEVVFQSSISMYKE